MQTLSTDLAGRKTYGVLLGENCFITGQYVNQDDEAITLSPGTILIDVYSVLPGTALITQIVATLIDQVTYKGYFYANIQPTDINTLGRGDFLIRITHNYSAYQVNISQARLVIA